MKTAADYRIENVRTVNLNGKPRRAFDAYVKQGDAFVFMGAFTAALRTSKNALWLIANESDTGSVE